MDKMISVVIPCYNEEMVIPLLYAELVKVGTKLCGYTFEWLFVDDGSSDRTLEVVKAMAEKDRRIVYISFSRNFGKEAAMYAGLCNAKGDLVVIMDADMQDPPSLLPDMVKIIEKGEYDSIATRRISRDNEPKIRSFFARMFYRIINKISNVDIVDGARDFRLMRRYMVDAIVAVGERNRFSKGIFGWVGFKTYWYPYQNVERKAGETKWHFWGLFHYAIDGIINFSQVPLLFASWTGIILTFVSILFIFAIIVRKLIFGDPVAGWPSLACIITFIGGIVLFCLGIIGQYIARIYVEVKERPLYIIRETNQYNK